jgi:asparagine synthase (glutamine-hydrolysing)
MCTAHFQLGILSTYKGDILLMCGIIGIVSRLPIVHRALLVEGCKTMIHRGPDDVGEWWSENGCVGLAHRRLSIIDLSPSGHQPMHDSTGTLSIVFNGEIYNFEELRRDLSAKGAAFRSQSDTEVILAAYREWGMECLSRLNGMFAFAIYDELKQVLFLARDRAGEKPLFYCNENGVFRFASELKALLVDATVSYRVDHEALDCYLAMGYVPGKYCILRGFNKLPPAHALSFNMNTGDTTVWPYWHLPDINVAVCQDPLDEEALLDELESLLEDSVRRQLVADVPVGVLLSGGVDSSLITAMAARASSNVKTFTIRFPGHGKFDETEHARLIARHFDTDHIELEAQPTTLDLLLRLAHQFDEPIVDSSMIPTFLVSQLVRQHCTVVLGGDGGDELFGGYHHYSRLLWIQSRLGMVPRQWCRAVSLVAERLLPVGLKGRNWLMGLGVDLQNSLPLIATHFDATTRQKLMVRLVYWPTVAGAIIRGRIPLTSDLLQRATRMDFCNYLAEDILVKVDRSSMLNSLEVRAPFLDYRLIEFAFGKVPSHLKATPQKKKILLKRLATHVLPAGFDQQRKQGLSIPLANWLKIGTFKELFHDVLLDKESIFDQTTVRRLLKGQDRGRSNSEPLFALVLFELWRREYRITL